MRCRVGWRDGRRDRHRRATAASELALLLPFLVLMLFAVLDFGRVYHTTQALQQAAQVGALYASKTALSAADPGEAEAARDAALASTATLNPPLNREDVTVVREGAGVTVAVRYEFRLWTPILGPDRTLPLTRTVTMPVAPRPGE